jgi:exodeoxyribonuclease VII small subunit
MNNKMTFEAALQQLEKLTKELEAADVPLDDMLRKYEEGVKFANFCMEKLSQAEQKIKILSGDDDATIALKESDDELPKL